MPLRRAAMDTMVVRSGLAYPKHFFGLVLSGWYDSIYDLIWSDETVAEYKDVLLDPGYLAEFRNEGAVEEFLLLLEWFGYKCPEVQIGELPWIRDEHDRKWEYAAIAAEAEWLVTLDNDFLQDADLIRGLRLFGVRVVTPAIFWTELAQS